MPAEFLETQFNSLEKPVNEPDVQLVATSTPLGKVVNQALAKVRQQLPDCHPAAELPRDES